MRAVATRDPKHLTVWQAWTYRIDKSQIRRNRIRRIELALLDWESFTDDPVVAAVSLSTLKEFRSLSRNAGRARQTIQKYEAEIVAIIRRFRELTLPRWSDLAIEDKQLTVREAFVRHYLPASQGMRPNSIRRRRYGFNWWERFTSNPAAGCIDESVFREVRTKGTEAGLSAVTIEGVVSDVLLVLRFLAARKILPSVPFAGKRLKRRLRLKPTPSISDLASTWANAGLARWPTYRWRRQRAKNGQLSGAIRLDAAANWWRAFLALAYFSGLRRNDLLTLQWSEIQGGFIRRVMEKTGFAIEIPVHPCLQTHLDVLPKEGPCVLGHSKSTKQIRRELAALAVAGGVAPFTVQSLRRLSARQFDKARPGAGAIILGHRYRGADRFYLDPSDALAEALPRLAVPEGMGPQPDLSQNSGKSVDALDVLRGLGRDELVKLLGELIAGKVPA
jgi:integrase